MGVPAPGVPVSDTPFVLVAEDLSPADTAALDMSKTLAIVTSQGGPTSHTAILARTMGIPALIGTPVDLESVDGKMAVVDGYTGTFYVDPDEETMKTMEEKRRERSGAEGAASESEGQGEHHPGRQKD